MVRVPSPTGWAPTKSQIPTWPTQAWARGSPSRLQRRKPFGCLTGFVEGDGVIGVGLRQECAQQLIVHSVARAKCAVSGQQGFAHNVEVAHGVEDFVFHELVVVAQSIGVEHLVVVHDDGVVQPSAQGQAIGTHHFHVFGKAEGAGAGNVTRIHALGHVEHHLLAGRVDGGVAKVDFEAELEAVKGFELGPLDVGPLTFADLHGFEHAQKTLGCVLFDDARTLQQKHKRRRRAVQNGHFFGGDVHIQVVDAQTCACRHEVLDGEDFGRADRDGGGQTGIGDRFSPHRDVHRLRQVHTPEHYAGVGSGRAQG